MTFGSELLDRQEDVEEFGQSGNEAIVRITDYIKRRTALTEDYARGLQRLNRQFQPVLEHETGLDDLLQASERISMAQLSLVEKVQDELLNGLKELAREHDRSRREALNEVRNSRAGWKKQIGAFEKIRKNRDAAVRTASEARGAFERANNDKNVTKAHVERLRDAYATEARRTLVAKEEFIQASRCIRGQQRIFYDEELPRVFDKLHRIEDARLTGLRGYLREFGNLLGTVAAEETSCCSTLVARWNALSPAAVLQEFIDRRRTLGAFIYPEEIAIDEGATIECLGTVVQKSRSMSEPRLSRRASCLLLCQDSEVLRNRLIELERDIPALERKQEGLRNLYELYESQPDLADEDTRGETEKQFDELSNELASLKLERGHLEKKLTAEDAKFAPSTSERKSSLGSPASLEAPISPPDASRSKREAEMMAGDVTPHGSRPTTPGLSLPIESPQSPDLSIINQAAAAEKPFCTMTARGSVGRVLFDFEALDEAYELSVKKGQVVNILSKDGEWCHVELEDGRVGYIPYNYIHA